VTEPLAAAVDAYVWGYPLVVMHRTRALHCSRGGPGRLVHRPGLATAASRTVVAPNNDTLYSSGWYDLRAGDLQVEVPPMDHAARYWSVMLLDAYTEVTYLCRRLHGVDGTTATLTLDPTRRGDGSEPIIPLATPTVWALVRVLVDGPDDMGAARACQEAIRIEAPAAHPSEPTPLPPGKPNLVHTAGARFFDELRAALAIDPPAAWHPPLDEAAAAWLEDPGLGGLDDEALAAAVAEGDRRLSSQGLGRERQVDGWSTRLRGSDFGDDVLSRAACAKYVLAGHHPAENRSYAALADETGARIDGSRPVELRFPPGGEPPTGAFWSLTVYSPDMFFVDNELDRYAIGDRTPGLVRDPDGGLTIRIGGPRPVDDRNWLPAGDGPYRMGLRVYEGSPEVVDATWFPPPLRPA
jgi:hypothetical protein